MLHNRSRDSRRSARHGNASLRACSPGSSFPSSNRAPECDDEVRYRGGRWTEQDEATWRCLRQRSGKKSISLYADKRIGKPFIRQAPPRITRHRRPAAMTTTLQVWSVIASRATNSPRSEEHTSELQSLMRISYAVL